MTAALLHRARTHLPALLVAAVLGGVTVRAVLEKTGGIPAVPLDDAFIHFQFARRVAELAPFTYSPGDPPVAGATSLLWPTVLAPAWALGLREERIVWAAWVLGFAALALLAVETARLGRRLLSPLGALAAGALVPCFGGYVWGAASGMEVVPFAWLLVLAARLAAERVERGEAGGPGWRTLVTIAWVVPLMRPEGALGSGLVAAALFLAPPPRAPLRRLAPVLALAGPLLPAVLQLALTGQAGSTTAEVKWLLLSPYTHDGRVWRQIVENLHTLFRTLLDGQIWSAIFLPRGVAPVLWLGPVAALVLGWRRRCRFRSLAVVAVALGMLLPTTYDSFLWNRLRYLWPFMAGWLLGVAALGEWLEEELSSRIEGLRGAGPLLPAAFGGALLTLVPHCIRDVAESADAIRRQQASLGRWARDALPENALLGVNDTGAIAYLSHRRTFDVVGLTTPGEGRYWVQGAGSRFEHYERLAPERRPTHFLVYPHWFAIPELLGEWLTERSVPGATILGGETMEARTADWSALGSGAWPARPPPGRTLVDEMDTADLESEAAHQYELLGGTAADNVAVAAPDGRLDGARRRRRLDRFTIALAPGGVLIARLGASARQTLTARVDGTPVGVLRHGGAAWEELELELPPGVPARGTLEITAEPGASFDSLHYWVYR